MSQQPKKGEEALNLLKQNLAVYTERLNGAGYTTAEDHIMRNAKLLQVENDGTVVWEYFLPPQSCHVGGSLHGGWASLIMDQLTSLSVAPHAHIGGWSANGGVTRTLVMTALRPAKMNTTVNIRVKVMNIGRTSLLLHGSIVSPDGKYIFNTVEHNKNNVVLKQPPKAEKL